MRINNLEVVDEDVEIDAIRTIVSSREGSKATGKGEKAVKGEKFDSEGEIGGIGTLGFVSGKIGKGSLRWEEKMIGVDKESSEKQERNVSTFGGHL